jgi:DNA mismatch endonuclease (patch repair protein)
VVFVDGCFWHACPEHLRPSQKNAEWWADKLARNVARDRETDSDLRAAGWTVLRVWEHEDPSQAADAVEAALPPR